MSYELHIHRAVDDWMNAADAPIGDAEWLALAEADPELIGDGGYRTQRPDGTVADVPTFTYVPPGRDEGCGFSLDPEDGQVTVAGAYDQQARVKAVQIAERLGARVQGDDGEWYGRDGDVLEVSEPKKRGLLGRLLGR